MTPPTVRGWLDNRIEAYEGDPDYVAEAVALHLIEEAAELMEEEGINRAELAQAMGVTRQRVTQIFNATPNLTLRSIAQLAIALNTRPHASLRPRCPGSGLTTYFLGGGAAATAEAPASGQGNVAALPRGGQLAEWELAPAGAVAVSS